MPCDAASARCDAGRNTVQDTPPCCLAHLREVLAETVRLLEAEGIPYWADAGTLLGAVRQAGVIPWDTDADLGILVDDVPRVLALAEALRVHGFALRSLCGGALLRVQYSPINDMGVDIYPWAAEGDEMVHPFKGRMSRSWLFPLDRVRFEGMELPAPGESRRWLTARYGPDWLEPRRGLPRRPSVLVVADPPLPLRRPGRGRRRGARPWRGRWIARRVGARGRLRRAWQPWGRRRSRYRGGLRPWARRRWRS